jgi:ubiquitin C-terminal hydrolase
MLNRRKSRGGFKKNASRVMTGITLLCFFTGCMLLAIVSSAEAKIRTCGSFYLRTEDGQIINPLTGENSDKPFSSRQTCGSCHDYNTITQGFHFQQGWDRISDSFSESMPWVLSDGMMGKH